MSSAALAYPAKSAEAFRTISEVAAELDVPQHVLRFWESRFAQVRPVKRAGGRRYYRPEDVELLRAIRKLLYDEGYTIKGVQRLHKEHGVRRLVAAANGEAEGVAVEAPADAGGAGPILRADARKRLQAVLADLEAVKGRIDTLIG